MSNKKKILFVSGTRADFGKLKSLMMKVGGAEQFELFIFATGMHMMAKYGMTVHEIEKSGFNTIYKYINQNGHDSMDTVLAKTVLGLGDYVKELKPDMIIVHGDRVEAMAGAIVGSLNNILVGHVEGGEVSGTIDELIRHSVSKMAHIHFVCNEGAKQRLLQLGELESSIYVIGSPDLDIMLSDLLPSLGQVKEKYEIPFSNYAVLMYHPVTTSLESLSNDIRILVDAIIESENNYVVIFPNNDHGSDVILNEYRRFNGVSNIKLFPSIRFECFLTLLKYSDFIVGNSSAGVREAPFYGLPTIDIGSRQKGRSKAPSVLGCDYDKGSIRSAMGIAKNSRFSVFREFGEGNSDGAFLKAIQNENLWATSKQKIFNDLF